MIELINNYYYFPKDRVKKMEQNSSNAGQVKIENSSDKEQILELHSSSTSKSNSNVGRKWSNEENYKLCLFMTYHQDIFRIKKDRQCTRIFKKFSDFVGTRTPRQCRSHYQKMMNRFKTPVRACTHYKRLLGDKKFTQRLEILSKQLKPVISSKKLKEKKEEVKKVDFSVQVNLDEECGYQNNEWPTVLDYSAMHQYPAYQPGYYMYPMNHQFNPMYFQ